jgi:hypothetical protein
MTGAAVSAPGEDGAELSSSSSVYSVSPSPASILTRTQVAADMTYPTFQAPWLQLSVVRVFAVVSYWKVLSTGAQIFIVDGDGEGGGNVLRLT